MRTLILFILALLLLNSCTNSRSDIGLYKNLFKGNSTLSANFNLRLDYDNQFDIIQQQVNINLCNGIYPINVSLKINEKQIETLLLYKRFCENDTNVSELPCTIVRSIDLMITAKNEILVNGFKYNSDSLNFNLKEELKKLYPVSVHFAAFKVKWDKQSSYKVRERLFELCMTTYQEFMSIKSEELFNKSIEKLSQDEFESLIRDFRFAFYIQNDSSAFILPSPPHSS
ncbi:MAG: hypothetical protein CVU05_10215 [Bacteroidetes bacterium HGW-Bacteroidetes-21]|nr:MAG: hypothetical protein CVU05_10215 [Bacteroidetes bacterium HGW-Bacteroidetes-21]